MTIKLLLSEEKHATLSPLHFTVQLTRQLLLQTGVHLADNVDVLRMPAPHVIGVIKLPQ
jgi:hypothetical protein